MKGGEQGECSDGLVMAWAWWWRFEGCVWCGKCLVCSIWCGVLDTRQLRAVLLVVRAGEGKMEKDFDSKVLFRQERVVIVKNLRA